MHVLWFFSAFTTCVLSAVWVGHVVFVAGHDMREGSDDSHEHSTE